MKNTQKKTKDQDILVQMKHAPILSALSPQDLARLVPCMKEQRYADGEEIFAEGATADTLYFILEGEACFIAGPHVVRKMDQGFLGEESVLGQPVYFYRATAFSSTTRLLCINGAETANMLKGYPQVKQDFSSSLLVSVATSRQYYSSNEPDSNTTEASKAHHVIAYWKTLLQKIIGPRRFDDKETRVKDKEIERLPEKDVQKKDISKKDISKKKSKNGELKIFVGWLLAFIIPIGLYNFPVFSDVPANTRIFISIFAVTILMWIFKLVPDYVAGLLTILVVLVLGITPSSVILGGFQSSSFFMAMSIFVLSAVVVSSGLVYRILLILLKYTPPSKFLYNLMVTLTGVMLTPIMPSVNGRVGLATPLLTDLIASLGYRRQGTDANRLAVSTFFGVSLFSAIFMTSKSINFVVFGMLPSQVQEGFQWINWMLAASAAGIVSLGLFLILSAMIYRSDERPQLHRSDVESQLKILGRITIAEWGAIIGIGLLIIGIVTTSIHKIKPAWIGLALMFMFLALETMGKKEFRQKIDWPFLFLLGTLIGLAKAISFLDIDQMISQRLGGLTGLMQENFYLFVLALAGIIFVIRFAVSINATVVIVASIFLPLSGDAGINAWVMGFIILTLSESFVLPYQCSYYVMFQGFNEKRNLYAESSFLKFNLWGFVIRILAIYASIPLWKALDILQ